MPSPEPEPQLYTEAELLNAEPAVGAEAMPAPVVQLLIVTAGDPLQAWLCAVAPQSA